MRYIHKGFRIQYVSRKKKNRDCEVDFTDYALTFKATGLFIQIQIKGLLPNFRAF